LALLI